MKLLLPESGLIFWMLISFGIVFFILAKYGFPVIINMVDKRREYIADSLEAAKEANTQLATIKTQSEELLAQARRQQMEILDDAEASRNRLVAQAKQEAQDVTRKELEHAREQIQAEKENAIREVRTEISVLSIQIAEKILRNELKDKDDQVALINKMIEEIPDLRKN